MVVEHSRQRPVTADQVKCQGLHFDDDVGAGCHLGQVFVGDQRQDVLLFGLGVGGLGASIKSGIIIDTGDRDANSHDSARVPLIWRRFALASEFRAGSAINSGEFNMLSGGDPIVARPPHAENAIQFVSTATM